MKHLLATILLAVLPTASISDARIACAEAWADIATVVGGSGAEAVTVGANGWCDVDLAHTTFVDTQIEKAAFRVDQMQSAPDDSRTIEFDLEGVDTPFGTFDGTVALSMHADTGFVRLHALRFLGQDGRGVRATAQAELDGVLVFPVQHQSQNAADAQFADIDIIVTPAALADTGIDFAQIDRASFDRALRDVSDMQISGKARRAFLRFVGAMPNAQGTLSIAVQMADDARMIDVVRPFAALGRAPSDADIAYAFDRALDGIQIDLAWKPGRM
ncbi:hypothetical protein [Roseobacter sp. CCS2]|uniref:hypothetical protein n=1 Tax=Roseobacter sp. CCS2 TaxID=391593 RepID=UPI0000F4049D|nr:hypothetical protein [Roseobacter sp. CCS2]EBA12885.1 hypothetical protein RCCS2_03349 [Roseobacter sp. CCS2]